MTAERTDHAERIDRLLQSRNGTDLVRAIAIEFANLHARQDALAEAIEEFRVLESVSGLIRSIEAPEGAAILPAAAEVVASDLLEPQDGFYAMECDSHGVPFRWTGPQRHFAFLVAVDRGAPLQVELDAICALDEARQRDLRLMVDGTSLPMALAREGFSLAARATLPPRSGVERTRLTFLVPWVGRPTTASDTRTLGIGFRRLVLRPDGS